MQPWIGLGRMGANMVRRLIKQGDECENQGLILWRRSASA